GVRPFEELDGSVYRRAFLVARDEEGDRAARRAVALQILKRCGERRRQSALHVDGAAAPEHPVGGLARERIETPTFRVARRHHVRMTGEHEAWPLAARHASVEIVDVGRAFLREADPVRLESCGVEEA